VRWDGGAILHLKVPSARGRKNRHREALDDLLDKHKGAL
jgi:hypothetical protein